MLKEEGEEEVEAEGPVKVELVVVAFGQRGMTGSWMGIAGTIELLLPPFFPPIVVVDVLVVEEASKLPETTKGKTSKL